jgi:enoyl reductase-like protein
VTDPWGPTRPYLDQLLGKLSTAGSSLGTLTPGQTAAFGELQANAGKASQFVPDIERLTRDYFATTSTAPMATDAYRRLETQIGGTAAGAGVNPMDDPRFKTLLDTVSADATNRVDARFAGAGRELSPENSAAVARAITQSQAPIVVDQYNRNIDRQLGAASTLYGAGQTTAQNVAGLDAASLASRERGIATASAALDALNMPANIRLQVEEQMKTLPAQELAALTQQLLAVAGVGGTTSGTQSSMGSQVGTGTQWGLNLQYPAQKG